MSAKFWIIARLFFLLSNLGDFPLGSKFCFFKKEIKQKKQLKHWDNEINIWAWQTSSLLPDWLKRHFSHSKHLLVS